MKTINGTIKHYAWGSMSAIPALLGTTPTLEPQAEYWLGAHPLGPASVDGEELDTYIAQHPECLGQACRDEFGDRFPYLLKVLAAAQPLSLQAHPTTEQAVAGFARENEAGIALDANERTYKDHWPKPELIVALTPFDALCGFRPAAETAELFRALGIEERLDSIIGPLTEREGDAALAEVFLDVLGLEGDRRHLVDEVVSAAIRHTDDQGPLGEFCRTAVELDEFHPGSPGIIAALLMNRVHLEPGQGLYLDAGIMHAYLRGTGIEIMANSDNVLRGGLTSKHIDVDELVRVVTFASTPTRIVERALEAPGLERYVTPAPHFALWRVQPGDASVALPAAGARVLLSVDGEATVTCGDDVRTLTQGQSVFLEADEHAAVTGTADLFLAGKRT